MFRYVYLLETPTRDVVLRPGVPPLESLLLVNDADDLADIFWRSWWLAASQSFTAGRGFWLCSYVTVAYRQPSNSQRLEGEAVAHSALGEQIIA
jgi:hypothetical protein